MSSVSSVQSYGSPLSRLQAQLGASVEAGSVKASDSEALAGAVDSIDASLRDDRAADAAPARPDPAAFKTRIEGLIGEQVSSGTLTSDQAEELKSVFAAAAPAGGPDGTDGAQAAGGLPPPPSPEEAGASQASRAPDASDTDRDALVKQFVEQLRQSVASGYSAGGAATRSARPLVFDVSA